MVNVQTLKGFRDFLPKDARKRQYVIDALKKVFESYGFEPLETPSLEYEEVLTGKYGQEGEKLMYKFKDNGDRNVALRYDQTVPLARVIAQYQNDLPMPFKRYQMQNVWRADNTQKGRYREFLQVDTDIVGSYSPLSDAEILMSAIDSAKRLGFENSQVWINDRSIFDKLLKTKESISILDKLEKIGPENVISEWKKIGIENAEEIMNQITDSNPSEKLNEIFRVLEKNGYKKDKDFRFVPNLARGLDYYTGIVFEMKLEDSSYLLSLGGGGRYDNLIGVFAGRDIPAVGFSFGFDRLMEAMEELDLFPRDLNKNNVFVAFSSSELQEKALELTTELRNKGVNAEYYLEDASLEKQLKYADKKQIPYCIIIEGNNLVLKNMEKRNQENLTLEGIIKKLK